ncbi:MAG: HAD-IC family P-type ATPase, partial [Actinomycetota bacterium]
MTARSLYFLGRSHDVTGEGYSPEGRIIGAGGDDPIALISALMPMALCNDAVVRRNEGDWELVGDPTEGALVVLAMKGGLDPLELRANRPRVAEVPFDSAHKFMATFHRVATEEGRQVVRLYVKGAPDVLMARSSRVVDNSGSAVDITPHRAALDAENARLAGGGLRVLAVASRDFDLDAMDDRALDEIIASTSVFARVSPEHKLRLVDALQRRDNVVAMTGDGVNDAPALKKADIGVAMGITGTEVTKEAATMVLTDDNFATIVRAIERGRAIYDNIVKFVKFQLSTTLGFALLFLGASILGIAHGKPFAAIAILWVNIIMDGPPAMALGLDKGDADIMERSPRHLSERILTKDRRSSIGFSSIVLEI